MVPYVSIIIIGQSVRPSVLAVVHMDGSDLKRTGASNRCNIAMQIGVTATGILFGRPCRHRDRTRRDGTAGSRRSGWPIGGQVGLRAWSCCSVRSRSVGSTVDGQYINCLLSLSADRRRRRILPSLSAHASPLHWWPVCLLCSPITATEMERQRHGSPPSRIRIVHGKLPAS